MNRIPGILSKPCTLTVNLVALHQRKGKPVSVCAGPARLRSGKRRQIAQLVRDTARLGWTWIQMARAAKREGLYSMNTADRDIAFTLERNFSLQGGPRS